MTHDPLARFRVQPRPTEPEEPELPELTEHQALGLAIGALGRLPDYEPLLQYELRDVYEKAELGLSQHQGHDSMTDAEIDAAVTHDLKLWEDARKDRAQAVDIEPER